MRRRASDGATLDALPSAAAWRHLGTREGFEAVTLHRSGTGYGLRGQATAVRDREAWAVGYLLALDERWITQRARVWGWSTRGEYERVLEADGPGRWRVDGRAAPELDGCLDVDLEASAVTNTVPVHRLRLDVGASADAPAVYVRALDFDAERLDQTYARLDDDGANLRFQYRAPTFDFEARIVFDRVGLVLDYPGIASRVL